MVFATGASVHGLDVDEGEFIVDVRLQMNVQPGIYLVDIGVWDRADERQLFVGPSLNLRVSESAHFLGEVNLNATMQIEQSRQAQPVMSCTAS